MPVRQTNDGVVCYYCKESDTFVRIKTRIKTTHQLRNLVASRGKFEVSSGKSKAWRKDMLKKHHDQRIWYFC